MRDGSDTLFVHPKTSTTMTKHLSNELAMRYCRQILLPEFDLDGQETLLNSRVLQIGVGGLGCASAQYLVAAGLGHLTLVDDDIVESSNLQRQVLHQESNLGQKKVFSAADSLRALNSHCQIEPLQHRLHSQELASRLAETDLVIDCSDNLQTRNQLNANCVEYKTPLVSGAAIRFEGQISSFIPGDQSPCYQCLSQFFSEQQLSCVESGVLSPLVGIIGAMQALEGIKILTNTGTNLNGKLLMFDGLTMSWNQFAINKNPQCNICGNHNKAETPA